MKELNVGSPEAKNEGLIEVVEDGVDFSTRIKELRERQDRLSGLDGVQRNVEAFAIRNEECDILMKADGAAEIFDNQEGINSAIQEAGSDTYTLINNPQIVDAVVKDSAMQEAILSPGDAVRSWRDNYYKAINSANEKKKDIEPKVLTQNPTQEVNDDVDMSYVQMADGSLYEKKEKITEEPVDMSYVQMADGSLYNSIEQSNNKKVETETSRPETINFVSTSEKSEETTPPNQYEWDDIVRPIEGEIDDSNGGGGGNNFSGGGSGDGNNGGGNEDGPGPSGPSPERRGRLTKSEYAFQIKKWKEMIDGTHIAVENVEKIVQDRRNSIFWRLKNLGLKNVTTLFRLRVRKSFNNLKEKAKNLFGFGKKKGFDGGEIASPLQEYFPHPGENLATIIKEQILGLSEMNSLTNEQKDAVVENLFAYAKKNPYMSMFDQVNKFSEVESVPTDTAVDLQMIKRLISFPVDEFGNKTIIEYSKNPS